MVIEKLVLLGHNDGTVPIMMDLASEIYGCRKFDIVKNLDLPDSLYPADLYHAIHFLDADYRFCLQNKLQVQFGVQGPNIKYQLYWHFFKSFGIRKENYLDLRHSSSYFATSASAENGLVQEPMTVVSTMSKIGFGVTIKRSASVGHHAVLGDFVSINPGAILSGYVTVGEGTEIGSGAVLSNNVSVGKRCLIGAGSVVTRDIPDGVIAFGNPCKVVRENDKWLKIRIEE